MRGYDYLHKIRQISGSFFMNGVIDNNYKRLFGFVLVVAVLLRFGFLPLRALDMDEAISYYGSKLPWNQLIECIESTGDAPLNYILHRYIAIFPNIYAIRMIHVTFGIMTVFFIMRISSTIFAEREAVLYSGMIAATSSIFLSYSMNSRMYALFSMSTAGMIYFLLRLYLENRWRDHIIYGIMALCLLYNHYMGMFVFISGIISVLFLWKKLSNSFKIRFFIVSVATGLLFCLWLPFLFSQVSGRGEVSNKLFISSGLIFPYTFYTFTLGKNLLNFVHKSDLLIFHNTIPALLIFSIFVGLTIYGMYKMRKKRNMLIVLITFMILPLIFSYIVSIKIPRILFETRYLISCAVPYYIFMGYGISKVNKKSIRIMILVLFMTINSLAFYKYLVTSENWKKIADFIEVNASKTDVLAFDARYMIKPFQFYYRGGATMVGLPPHGDKDYLMNILNESNKRVWLIVSHNYRSHGIYIETMDKTRNLKKTYDFVFAKIYLYDF